MKWSHGKHIENEPPVPKTSPRALAPELVARVIAKRLEVRRCAIVVCAPEERGCLDIALQREADCRHILRAPEAQERVGENAEVTRRVLMPRTPERWCRWDTIHFFGPDGVKRYVYTALDVYSRTGYAMASDKANAVVSTRFFDGRGGISLSVLK